MTVDRPSVVVGIFSFLLFVFALHRIACWRTGFRDRVEEFGNRWTWRSTIVVSSMMTILFAAGITLVGASHQFVWLFSGRSSRATAIDTSGFNGMLAEARDKAQRSQCRNNLKHFAMGFLNYHDAVGAFLP